MRRWVFGAGTAEVAASAILLGAALYVYRLPGQAAVILGLVLSLSSTAVVMQLMSGQHSTGTRLGQAAFAVLMLQHDRRHRRARARAVRGRPAGAKACIRPAIIGASRSLALQPP